MNKFINIYTHTHTLVANPCNAWANCEIELLTKKNYLI